MKNKIAIASAFIAASSFSTAEIVVNDFLSFEGFVDMSYSQTDMEVENNSGNRDESENSFAIDQVEISWLFDFDPVTAQIDLQYEDLPGDTTAVEQAFVTYHFDNGGAITAGRYASMLGFEAFEPTGLYQYSFAYDIHSLGTSFFGPDTSDLTILPGYAQGVKYTYETDTTFFGISLQDEAFDDDNDRLGGDGDSSYAFEIAGSIAMDNGLAFFLGGVFEEADLGDTYVINAYTTFETGAWLFAGELNYGESESGAFAFGSPDEEVFTALLMANFAYSDQASVTGRLTYINDENSTSGADQEFTALKYTIAHGYAFTDNLFLVNELSYVDGEIDAGGNARDYESLLFATELIFSF
ncbi:outer membrane beta-barrel protein [Coraliomargarita sp. SDUM461004]|uniref:Outer membrane beta-barrel protein n=1 Tax=Thalassobacterium sedimentorum TaxID=3041258 RepID=A0ABU1AFU8_9BACT|nr:outer membrane beta-barrel protein [Coraliomargarita sp. SDUM461004]MDQ8193589.1 outer membrane beta-barrel protein [Coraliomargarita sp. SDUM461004]